jgi:hypothetical protein
MRSRHPRGAKGVQNVSSDESDANAKASLYRFTTAPRARAMSTTSRAARTSGTLDVIAIVEFGMCSGQGEAGDIDGAFEHIEDAEFGSGTELVAGETCHERSPSVCRTRATTSRSTSLRFLRAARRNARVATRSMHVAPRPQLRGAMRRRQGKTAPCSRRRVLHACVRSRRCPPG